MNQQTGQFDVCCSTAAPGLPISSSGSRRPGNNFQQSQRRPHQQQQSQRLQQPGGNNINNQIPQGSCPAINNLPDISSCNGMVSNCWSVGQPDVDCPGNALCCFDGCRNTCYFGGKWECCTGMLLQYTSVCNISAKVKGVMHIRQKTRTET